MPVHLLRETPDYRLGIWKIEETEEELFGLTGSLVPPTLVNRVRRQEFLAVRALAAHMGIKATNIHYRTSGKPYLKECPLTISISHTKGYVAVLLSPHELAGVDVEICTERIHRIRQKFMHPHEESRLQEICGPSDETLGLLLHWCAKEAMFKAVPEEGIDFIQELRVTDFATPVVSGIFKGCFLRTYRSFQIEYLLGVDYVLTCSFSAESK
jgi:4'-phosphopantetheinyl transferase